MHAISQKLFGIIILATVLQKLFFEELKRHKYMAPSANMRPHYEPPPAGRFSFSYIFFVLGRVLSDFFPASNLDPSNFIVVIIATATLVYCAFRAKNPPFVDMTGEAAAQHGALIGKGGVHEELYLFCGLWAQKATENFD